MKSFIHKHKDNDINIIYLVFIYFQSFLTLDPGFEKAAALRHPLLWACDPQPTQFRRSHSRIWAHRRAALRPELGHVAAAVRLCMPSRGLETRAARQVYLGWLGQETWEGNGLSGPLNGSHLTFYSIFFSISIFRNSSLHKSTKWLDTLSNA
jgi:hypothetical protein